MKRLALSIMMGALLAATATVSYGADEKGKIGQRAENQQDRIGQGVENGSLTAGETAHLEHREAQVNKEVRHDRKVNGGNLTNKEKAQINHQQNQLSKQIYKDKHNGRKQP